MNKYLVTYQFKISQATYCKNDIFQHHHENVTELLYLDIKRKLKESHHDNFTILNIIKLAD
jgi:hypothetical protein